MKMALFQVIDSSTGHLNTIDTSAAVILTPSSLASRLNGARPIFLDAVEAVLNVGAFAEEDMLLLGSACKPLFWWLRDHAAWARTKSAGFIWNTPGPSIARHAHNIAHHKAKLMTCFESVESFYGASSWEWEPAAAPSAVTASSKGLSFPLSPWLIGFYACHNGQPDAAPQSALIYGMRFLRVEELPEVTQASLPAVSAALSAAGARPDRSVAISPLPLGSAGQQLWVDCGDDAVYCARPLGAVRVASNIRRYLMDAVS